MGRLITICGNDKELRLSLLEEEIKKIKTDDTDIIYYDQEEGSLALFLEELNTIPFLASDKIVVLTNSLFLYKSQKYDSKLIEAFIKFLNHPTKTTSLIILVDSVKDICDSLRDEIYKNTIIIEAKPLDESSIDSFIKDYLKQEGYEIGVEALNEFRLRVSNDYKLIKTELLKLITYKGENKIIDTNDIHLLISKNIDSNIFDLSNAIMSHNRLNAIRIYRDLKFQNLEDSQIIAFLVKSFNDIYQVKSLEEGGYTKNDIAEILKVKPGRVYYMMKNASQMSLSKIRENLNYLIDLDYGFKTGTKNKDIGLELFLLK